MMINWMNVNRGVLLSPGQLLVLDLKHKHVDALFKLKLTSAETKLQGLSLALLHRVSGNVDVVHLESKLRP